MPEVPWHVPISADPAVVGRISMLSHNGRVAMPLRVTNSRVRVRLIALRGRTNNPWGTNNCRSRTSIRRSCCRAKYRSVEDFCSRIHRTLFKSFKTCASIATTWDTVPAGIPGHQLAGIPCHATMRHAASAVLSALCAQRRCMRKRGRVTAGAELVRLNRPSSTSPGGKVQCGHYWTRRGAPGMRPVGRAPHVWRVASGSHSPLVPHPASASATPAFPARARWKMAPAPGRPPRLAGRASGAIAVACRALPRPERLRGICAQRSHPVRTLPAAQGRQHCHARAGPVGS